MFFMMGGAIFVHTYFVKVSSKLVSFYTYMKKRFARLYPLHLATLLIVAILQGIYTHLNGNSFIFQFNDLKNFMLHLFFISDWGFEEGHGFNGPVW